MAKLSKTEYRHFLDLLSFLGKKKEFSTTFVAGMKGAVTFKDIDKILETKRRGYNFEIVTAFSKYGILPEDDIYQHLDDIWSGNNSKLKSRFKPVQLRLDNILKSALLYFNPAGHIAVNFVEYERDVQKAWEDYKAGCYNYAENYAQGLIDG